MAVFSRHYPIGAEIVPGGGASFRVWAPDCHDVEVVLENAVSPAPAGESLSTGLSSDGNGYFSGTVPSAREGTRYRFRLNRKSSLFPDPASRFQPEGPLGPSEVVDPAQFDWHDCEWKGVALPGQVIYEMHIGTFTPEGTFESAAKQLETLAETGITVIEMMPVAEFAGRFGWGYDGVDLFAPYHFYGRPDNLREFIDKAHRLGIGVILDVVYNHFGPSGNFFPHFSSLYSTDRYSNEWGESVNFDGDGAGPVREFFIANAVYWTEEFHFDGFRLDATQNIHDKSPRNIIAEITGAVRRAAKDRSVVVIAENESQRALIARPPDEGGYGCDALWNDDFHHSAMVALTGHNESYYTDYLGKPQELVSEIKWGYLYQGQRYQWQKKRRGTPSLDLPPYKFVLYIQNHDQMANSGQGLRIDRLTSPGRYRAMTALLLLAPGTPLLFQGQEFAASAPFLYFADIPELADDIRGGRVKFLKQFRSLAQPEMLAVMADPGDPGTFERCKLRLEERTMHTEAYDLHRDLLKLRREDPVFHAQRRRGVDGAVLGAHCFLLRFFGERGDDRLVLINLGRDLHLDPAPEPLLAPPEEKVWKLRWSSEDPRYGGMGTSPIESYDNWRIPGEAAVVMIPGKIDELTPKAGR